jgi:hypothetical protein
MYRSLIQSKGEHESGSPTSSVAAAIADVFRKNGINVTNKFVRIMKIFTKINDLKNRGVI